MIPKLLEQLSTDDQASFHNNWMTKFEINISDLQPILDIRPTLDISPKLDIILSGLQIQLGVLCIL